MKAKIDMHVHCARQRIEMPSIPGLPVERYIADWRELAAHLRAQGIGRAVLMSGGETSGAKGQMNTNEDSCAIAAQMPDFYAWMCNLDAKDPDAVKERLARYKAMGAVGVGELAVNEWMDSPFLTAVFAAAEELELPVTIHMSPRPGYQYGVCDRPGLQLLEQTLRRFPGLKLLGHSQVFWLEISADCPREGDAARSGMGKGPVVPGGSVERLMYTYPNLYGDLSAFSGSCAILRDEAYGLAFLEAFSERLFFATDAANKTQTFPLAAFLDESVRAGKLSETAWRNICFENAHRVFGL